MTAGQRVREKRRERELTLKQLADKTDLSITYLSDIERNRTRPSFKTLERISQALEMTTTDLMHGVEDWGALTPEALPPGLDELRAEWDLDDEWVRTLTRVDYRGRRPQTKEEWLEVYLALKRILRTPGSG